MIDKGIQCDMNFEPTMNPVLRGMRAAIGIAWFASCVLGIGCVAAVMILGRSMMPGAKRS